MLVTLKVNIGTVDARRLSLPKTHEGDAVEVSEKVAAELLKNGWATEAATTEPKKIHAVPPVEVKATAAPAKPIPGK